MEREKTTKSGWFDLSVYATIFGIAMVYLKKFGNMHKLSLYSIVLYETTKQKLYSYFPSIQKKDSTAHLHSHHIHIKYMYNGVHHEAYLPYNKHKSHRMINCHVHLFKKNEEDPLSLKKELLPSQQPGVLYSVTPAQLGAEYAEVYDVDDDSITRIEKHELITI